MSEKLRELSVNQRKAIKALLAAPSVAAAARQCGLSDRTLWHYLEDDTFKAELREMQDKATVALAAGLAGLSGEAVQALHDLLTDAKTPASVKQRAALGWLRETRQTVELGDLVERVKKLEDTQNEFASTN